uniref:Methylosome subunit pICln n=1 Tax=Anolis carolinensis TaxID=28377 RepID=A0A803TR90_ANOCA
MAAFLPPVKIVPNSNSQNPTALVVMARPYGRRSPKPSAGCDVTALWRGKATQRGFVERGEKARCFRFRAFPVWAYVFRPLPRAAMSFLRRLPEPSEGVRLRQAETEAVLGGRRLGSGTLFVAESRLSWIEASGLGFSLDYPTISLHAISRDLAAYPWEHLYVMVNGKFEGMESYLQSQNEVNLSEIP